MINKFLIYLEYLITNKFVIHLDYPMINMFIILNFITLP